MSKKLKSRDIYSFNVFDEVKNGTEVFCMNKLHPGDDIVVINEMPLCEALELIDKEGVEFWTVFYEEEKEETVNG